MIMYFLTLILIWTVFSYFSKPSRPDCHQCGRRGTYKLISPKPDDPDLNDVTEYISRCSACGHIWVEKVKPVTGEFSRWVNTKVIRIVKFMDDYHIKR